MMSVPKGLLEFSNHLVQLQWVSATLRHIERDSKKNGSPLTTKSPHVSLILSGTQSPCLATVQSSCSSLLSAVSHGWLDHQSLLAALVIQTSTAKYRGPVIWTIAEMLAIEVKAMVAALGCYTCPYSIRTSIHPFISVWNLCPETGLLLVAEMVQLLLGMEVQLSAMLLVFEPFIKFVLLHPVPTFELTLVAKQLHFDLISVAKASLCSSPSPHETTQGTAILNLLSKMTFLQPVRTTQQLMFVVSMTQELVTRLCGDSNDALGSVMPLLLDSCFSLCCELAMRGLPSQSLLTTISCLLHNNGCVCHHHWFSLSWLLLRNLSTPWIVHSLLNICKAVLSKPNDLFLHLLIFPLVQVLSQPLPQALRSHDTILTNQRTAAHLLKLIQVENPGPTISKCALIRPTSCSHKYTVLVAASDLYTELTSTPSKMATWLSGTGLSSGHTNSDIVLIMLAAISLGPQPLDQVFPVFSALAKCDPTTSPSILTFYLHLQSLLESPGSKLDLFYSIPSLATHKLATIGIVNMLQVLGGNPSLIAMATRLMGQVWALQDNVFPHLLGLLQRPVPPHVAMETELARAVVIKEICCSKAEQHGEEMLSLISGVLSGSHDPLPVAMVIEGLTALCNSEVVDVVTVWGVLGKRITADQRVSVLCAVCEMLSLASDHLLEEKQSHLAFKTTALSYLWSSVFSKNTAVCSAALKGLGKFQLADFFVSHLPDKVSAQLGIISPDPDLESHDAESSAIPLVGSHCVQLITFIPTKSLPSYIAFLAGLLGNEVKALPRGTIYSAIRQAQVPSQFERFLLALPGRLRAMLKSSHSDQDSNTPLASRLSFMSLYEPSTALKTHGRVSSRKQAGERLQQSLSTLERLLRETVLCVDLAVVTSSCECMASLVAIEQWQHFMATLVDAFYTVRLMEISSVSIQDNPADPVLKQKQAEAMTWARSQVLERLVKLANDDCSVAHNVLMALVALASCSNPIGQPDHMTESSQSETCKTLLLELSVAVEGILTTSDSPSSTNHISNILTKCLDDPKLKVSSILSLPHLVDTVLNSWDCLPASVATKLVTLAEYMFDEFNRSPLWYVAISLSQMLQRTLPLIPKMEQVLEKVVPFIDISMKAQNMDLLLLTSAFLPVLCLFKKRLEMAAQLLSSLHTTFTTLTPSQLLSPSAQLVAIYMANALPDCLLAGVISDDVAIEYVQLLAQQATNSPSEIAYHFSLSLSLNGLSAAGLKSAQTLSDTIAAQWLQQLGSQKVPHVAPFLWGLAGLLGVNPVTSKCTSGVLHLNFLSTLLPLVIAAMEKLVSSSESAIVSNALWLLTQSYRACSDVLEQCEKVPQGYGYLPESGVLNSLFLLVENLAAHPSEQQRKVLSHLLQTFVRCDSQVPPTDFSSVLIALFRYTEVRSSCVACLISNGGVLGFRQLAIHCCNPKVFVSMQLEDQCKLVEDLPSILACLPLNYLSQFLQMVCKCAVNLLLQSQDKMLFSFLKGGNAILRKGELPAAIKHLLVAITTQLYSDLCSVMVVVVRESQVVREMADCLRLCGTTETQALGINCLSCALHCSWVANGDIKFGALSSFVEWTLTNTKVEEEESSVAVVLALEWLLETIEQCCSPSSCNSLLQQTELLHQLSAWARNNSPSSLQMTVMLKMMTCAVNQATSETVFALKPWKKLESVSLSQLCSTIGNNVLCIPESSALRERICQCLTEWLAIGDDHLQKVILGFLSELRSCEEFHKPVIWTTVAHVL